MVILISWGDEFHSLVPAPVRCCPCLTCLLWWFKCSPENTVVVEGPEHGRKGVLTPAPRKPLNVSRETVSCILYSVRSQWRKESTGLKFSQRGASSVYMSCTVMAPRCSLLSFFIHKRQGPDSQLVALTATHVSRTSSHMNWLNSWKGKCCVSGPAFGLFLVASENVLDASDLFCEMRERCCDSGSLVQAVWVYAEWK